MKILETERMIFRRLRPDDLDALAVLYRDPETRRYFPEGTLSRAETEEELDWFRNGHPEHPELGLWAAILKQTGAFIGRCGLLPWTIEGVDEVEIAYSSQHPINAKASVRKPHRRWCGMASTRWASSASSP